MPITCGSGADELQKARKHVDPLREAFYGEVKALTAAARRDVE